MSIYDNYNLKIDDVIPCLKFTDSMRFHTYISNRKMLFQR
jgi:hypothetical protein